MTSWLQFWKYDNKSKIQLGQLMHIHVENISAKFHPDLIWNKGALGFLDQVEKQQQEQEVE